MKPSVAAAVLILSSLLASHVRAAEPVEAKLSLEHDHVLPGVPFDMVLTYTNVSKKPVSIAGAMATLVVTFPDGETSVVRGSGNDRSALMPSAGPLRLAPGESALQAVSWNGGYIPNWSRFSSFSGPGTYGIALDLDIADELHEPLASLRTAPVKLTRIEPVGIDAELWKRMQASAAGKWTDDSFGATKQGAALADEIIQLHPTSGYYPYVLALRAFWRDKEHTRIPALLEAAERFESSPAHPYLLKAAADLERSEAWKAQRERDDVEAVKHFEVARGYYRDALATKSVAVRGGAEEGLRDVAYGLERAAKQRQ